MLLEIMVAIYAALSLSAAIVAFTGMPDSWTVKFAVALFAAVAWPLLFVATALTFLVEK